MNENCEVPDLAHLVRATATPSATLRRVFGSALLGSAFLLFCVEPMVAKMLLPLLGGVPAVWSACLVFFQGALLLGYLFSLATLKWLGPRRQAVLQVVVVLAPLLVLPIVINDRLAQRFATLSPSFQALAVLTVASALPFFAISTVAPTLQRWYSTTDAPGSNDPYFLYSASNLGSLCGLIAYPLLLEPNIGLKQQTALLSVAYTVIAFLVCLCAAATFKLSAVPAFDSSPQPVEVAHGSRWRERVLWLLLSAVPSAYLVAVTSHLTTDVTPAPFLWVLPLAAYLLSFVVVFASKPPLSRAVVFRYFPIAATFVVYLLASGQGRPLSLVAIPAHVLTFFIACLLCHGELVHRRPAPNRLNEFYAVTAAGGFCGGIAVALLAPQVLSFQIEYPVCLALSLVARSLFQRQEVRGSDCGSVIAVLGSTLLLARWLPRALPESIACAVFALPALAVAFHARSRAMTFAACLAALLVGAALRPDGETLFRSRNFFGVVQVRRDPIEHSIRFLHGTTLHGSQSTVPALRRTPMTYYSRVGPAGDAFAVADALEIPARVGVIGLGAGTLATYAKHGAAWTFFEINPEVVTIATNPRLFSYLSDAFAGGESSRIVLGDARLALRSDPGNYRILVVDAFSADSIPVHLVTSEALALYQSKTANSGVIAWHISNRYIKLAPVLARLASAAGMGALRRLDFPTPREQLEPGARLASEWVVMSKDPTTLAKFPKSWQPLKVSDRVGLWTDDSSSVLAALSLTDN